MATDPTANPPVLPSVATYLVVLAVGGGVVWGGRESGVAVVVGLALLASNVYPLFYYVDRLVRARVKGAATARP